MKLIKTWRWFGGQDPVQLHWLKEMGVEEVVTALHHIPNGEIWPVEEINNLKIRIERAGLRWSVVESLPVTEAMKTGAGQREKHIYHFKASLQNLSLSGIKTVVYNFMPVLDWARTNLHFRLPSGGISMLFDFPIFAAFDMFILKRPGAEKDYPLQMVIKAERLFREMTQEEAEKLAFNIIVKTQGFIDGVVDADATDFKQVFLNHLNAYSRIGREQLQQNLLHFLNEVVPVAEKVGINLAIHPDDPPFPVLGLPRIFSTIDDMEWLQNACPSLNNGVAFCAGSFSARKDNDLIEMTRQYGQRFHFIHLRNTQMLDDGSFYETGHLEGGVNMPLLVKTLLEEMQKRRAAGRKDCRIPMRPDHGIKIMDDFNLKGNPGYPLIGRLKGMAEISGIEEALLRIQQ